MKRALTALLLAGLVASCSAPGTGPGATGAGGRQRDRTGSAAPSPGPVDTAGRSGQAPGGGASGRTGTGPLPDPSVSVGDFVKAMVPEEEAWGPNCFVPRPGSVCLVPFDGVAYLASRDQAKIALLAFENGGSNPAATRLLTAVKGSNRLCPEAGCPHGGATLTYTPGLGARSVTLVVELRTVAGGRLARGFPQTFPIHS